MPRGIQEQDVWQAADALLLEGARPTIERVRQKIGRGSPNTVSPHLETWFKHLGRRIKDPGAFSAPSGVPDPVLQAAQHFWETALAQTRADFDERLQDGLASAVANVEAEKEKAAQANAAAFEAAARATKLQAEFAQQGDQLNQVQQDLASERARLEETRAALVAANERMRRQHEQSAAALADVRQQLAAALERADAADRRVALELDRERTARTKAERQAESLQKGLDGARDAASAAGERSRRQLDAARDREEELKAQLLATAAELTLERERLAALRTASEASAADAAIARAQVAGLQGSLERLAALVEADARREPKTARRRTAKPSSPTGGP
ncbi:DNA-binding protein [Ideonella sp. YS5]|uniref:DNA-binding protein n=1 Tax=Ideonella sp. YS5 TaxID=3453714 RepID=UPI003EEE716E